MTKNNKNLQKILILTILIIPLILLFSIFGLNNKIALAEDNFSVNFNIDGIVCADKPENQTILKDQTATEPANPTYNEYVFDGWFQSVDNGATLNDTAFDFSTIITENLELFAKWSDVPYMVKYYFQNKEDEEYTIDDTKTANLKGVSTQLTEAVELPNDETLGFTLVAIEQQKIAADGSTVVEVKYNRNEYNITYNKNGGDFGVEPSATYKYGTTFTLPTNITKVGHNFVGWYDNEAFSGDVQTEIADTSIEDVTYYAKYDVETYGITYNKDGGNFGIDPSTSYEYGTAVTLPIDLSKEGYNFVGWYSDNTFAGEAITNISDTSTGSQEFYAKFDAQTYSITYNKDGGNFGVEPSATYEYGTAVTLPTDITKEGCNFVGWYSDNTFTGEAITGISETTTGSQEFYAKFEVETYSITYNKNGGDFGVEPTASYEYGTIVTLPTDLTKEGYNFVGWYDNEVFTGDAKTEITDLTFGNQNFYAKYEALSYNISYVKNGGEFDEVPRSTYKHGTAIVLPKNITKEGYVFVGWFDNVALSGEAIANIEATFLGDKTFYAKFKKQTFNITFNKNGGVFGVEPSLIREYGTAYALTNDISKEGYEFVGWYDNASFTGEKQTEIADSEVGDKEFFAKFDKESYIIKFTSFNDENFDDINLEFGGILNLPVATKVGYDFNGWYLAENNGNGFGEKFELIKMNDIGANGEVLNLYANWTTAGKVNVRWLDGDGNVLKVTEVEKGETPILPNFDEEPTHTEDAHYIYKFNGWPDLVSITKNTDITAKFNTEAKLYSYEYVDMNDKVLEKEDLEYGKPIPFYSGIDPTKPSDSQYNYEFVSWDFIPDVITEDITIRPVFEKVLKKFIIKWYIDSKYPSKSTVEYGKLPECNANLTKCDNDLGKDYVFVKWDKNLVPAVCDTEYHAIFRPTTLISYNIEYELNGGSFEGEYKVYYDATVGIELPTKLTKKGYVFGGWYLRNDLIGENTTAISTTDYGNKLFYAKWNVKKLSHNKSKYKQEIVCEEGIDGNAEFVIKALKSSEIEFSKILTDDEKIETIYSSELMLNGAALEMPSGNYTVRMAVDTKASKIQVLVVENGKITKKIATVENGYATWQVSELGDFAILKSKLVESSKIGQLIGGFVLGFSVATIVCFALVTLIVLIKKKKNEIYI